MFLSPPFKLTDVNTHIEEERKVTREVREQLGLTDRRCNAMAGELEESKALLEAAIRHVWWMKKSPFKNGIISNYGYFWMKIFKL